MEGKKIKGRKRHICTDTLGNLLHAKVHAANVHDTKGGLIVFAQVASKYPSIDAFSADLGYRGTSVRFVQNILNKTLNISRRISRKFALISPRWVVERTFAWLGNFRRLSKDFEILTSTAENVIYIAMMKITVGKCI